ncbi:MAG TPA: glycosyltransferase family 2 protein [Bryobacteraceae bacterium]|nr:glycosyltransferase family 2 protein [Bryobacteraceae bacterium]
MSSQIDISLIIISLNSRHFLVDCLRSIRESVWRDTTYEVIVVDNASTDGTVEMLAASYPYVRVIANKTNVGYCKAGNQGAEIAKGRYFMHLNDDILIVEDAFPKLVEWMDHNPKAGMIGSRLLNPDGTDQFSSGRSYTTPMAALFGRKSVLTRFFPDSPWARNYLLSDRIDDPEPYQVDWLSAAAMMSRREAYFEVSGLAEDYYYFHEQVIAKRLAEKGWTSYLHPQSKIIHYEGVGSGVRTKRVRRKHIEAFHRAAHRWFAFHHELGPVHPVRWLSAVLLAGRAGFLMALETIKPDPVHTKQDMEKGRPEGGVAI